MTEKQLKHLRIRLQSLALELEYLETEGGKFKCIGDPLMNDIRNWVRDLEVTTNGVI